MNLLDEERLQKLELEDLDTLVQFDENGFICGKNESGKSMAQRLRDFRKNLQKLEDSLQKDAKYDCEGIVVTPDDRISQKRFQNIAQRTSELYRFAISWVPGFYIDPDFSLLFGGCAFCQYPDFFTLFIIRRSFKHKQKWLIYDRDELLAHELCHVSRIALEATRYEETFAYQTSKSAFRRTLGGMFYKQTDSFLFLGAALLILVAQVVRTFAFPQLPIEPFWGFIAVVFFWLFGRNALANKRLDNARRNVEKYFPKQNAWPVLFRCTDEELLQLAKLSDENKLKAWLEDKKQTSLRWKVIMKRFANGETTP